MLLKDLKYKAVFSAIDIKPIVSEEKDKYLSLASLDELARFIPEIDMAKDIDLLPIAFDACVVNRVNKNGDIMDTDTAIATYKRFIRKFIDTEHNRQKVVGVITSASFSAFGTNKPLTEDEVRGTTEPFNITLGGIIWKAVNSDLCDLIEDSNDPTSENYKQVSASWELGFSDYKIVELPQGEKNLVNPIEVEDEIARADIKKYLKCFGGSGVKDGKSYYRMPYQNVIPMGIGLTEKPAADVSGVATIVTPVQDTLPAQAELSEAVGKQSVEETKKIISQTEKESVKLNRINSFMKITSISDINDENLKQCTASQISEFIASEIKKGSDEFAKTSTAKEQMVAELKKKNDDIYASFSELQKTVATLQREREERQGVDTFNFRMSEIHASYELPAEVAAVVASDVKSLASDEAYASYKTKAAIMLKPYKKSEAGVAPMHGGKDEHNKVGGNPEFFNKKSGSQTGSDNKTGDSPKQPDGEPNQQQFTKADEEDGDAMAMTDGPKKGGKDESVKRKSSTTLGPEDDKKESKHEKNTDKSEATAIAAAVEDALDNGSKEKGGLPNGTSATSKSIKDKYAQAFAVENFIVK